MIQFPLRTVALPPVHSPDVLYSISLGVTPRTAAGSRH